MISEGVERRCIFLHCGSEALVSVCSHVSRREDIVNFLSHALKNTANQKRGLPLHILQYATGDTCMQWVVFHSTFLSLLARNSLLGSF